MKFLNEDKVEIVLRISPCDGYQYFSNGFLFGVYNLSMIDDLKNKFFNDIQQLNNKWTNKYPNNPYYGLMEDLIEVNKRQ